MWEGKNKEGIVHNICLIRYCPCIAASSLLGRRRSFQGFCSHNNYRYYCRSLHFKACFRRNDKKNRRTLAVYNMLPHQHVFWGAVFAFIILIILPDVAWYNILLLFLSTFLIDFDHYLASLINKRKYLSLRQSFKYHMDLGKIQYIERKRGIRRKGDFHIFHTLEFHILVFIIGLF